MLSIRQVIEQKQAQVSKLLGEIEVLENAEAILGSPQPKKRGGRPKGSKNKATKKRRGRKEAKKTGAKGTGKRGRKAAFAEAPAES